MSKELIIGSRGSRLALWQSRLIKAQLEKLHSDLHIEISIIKTTGDQLATASLVQIGGKGVFTKELEEALLDHRIDLAVHSLKDLPTTLPEGLSLAAVTEREDVRDALLIRTDAGLDRPLLRTLPFAAVVGTSSLRRASQLRFTRPDLIIEELRGNVETRIRKLDEGGYTAIVLATAGLVRLGYDDRISERLEITEMLPAVGQGALGIETRAGDSRVAELLQPLDHPQTSAATTAERAVLRALGGGCAVPIAAHGRFEGSDGEGRLVLDALVAALDGSKVVRGQIVGAATDAAKLGEALAGQLIQEGASQLLDAFRIGK